jgi:hypothetical protein
VRRGVSSVTQLTNDLGKSRKCSGTLVMTICEVLRHLSVTSRTYTSDAVSAAYIAFKSFYRALDQLNRI